jgi:hypothetical protein
MVLKGYSEVTLPLNAHTVDFRSAGKSGSREEAELQETLCSVDGGGGYPVDFLK